MQRGRRLICQSLPRLDWRPGESDACDRGHVALATRADILLVERQTVGTACNGYRPTPVLVVSLEHASACGGRTPGSALARPSRLFEFFVVVVFFVVFALVLGLARVQLVEVFKLVEASSASPTATFPMTVLSFS